MKNIKLEFTRNGETAKCEIRYKTNDLPDECVWSGQFYYYQGVHGEYDFREFPIKTPFSDLNYLANMVAAFSDSEVTMTELG